MAKLLKILTIPILLLSIGGLVFAILLFNKRELLLGRTRSLEAALMKVAATIENEPPPVPDPKTLPARDISPVTSEMPEKLDTSKFWETKYSNILEQGSPNKVNLALKKADMMRYYFINGLGERERDQTTGNWLTTGEGTLDSVVTDLLAKAEEQYNRLNDTRQQMIYLRDELIATIEDVNAQRAELRKRLKEIEELKAEIVKLNGQIEQLKADLAKCQAELKASQDKVADLERTITEKDAVIAERDLTIQNQSNEIKRLRVIVDANQNPDGTIIEAVLWPGSPGVKGSIAAVKPEWDFVIISPTAEFLDELVGKDPSKAPARGMELWIKRGDKAVGKVRVTQVRPKDKYLVADILPGWKIAALQKGDTVIY